MNNQPHAYSLCGWRLRSDIPLSELPDWTGEDGVEADEIRFVIGPVPSSLGECLLKTDSVEVGVDGNRALMNIRNVAAYLIENGNRITIEPHAGLSPDASDIRLFLLGGAFGYLCHQRGPLPIHASAVEVDGRAVLFTGVSGAGKSTLATAFLRRGHRLVSDDVAPIELAPDAARVLPNLARIRLWPDSASQAQWPVDQLERCRSSLLKVARPIEAEAMTKAIEPLAIFHLQPGRSRTSTVDLTPISGPKAVMALGTRVYRERGLMATVGRGEGTKRIAATAARIPHHFRLERRIDYAALPATVDAIIEGIRAVR